MATNVALALSLFAAMAGYFGPWVAHEAAALVLTGQDLGEFVKFLPSVRSGQLHVVRELFYIPLLAASMGLVLVAGNRRLQYPRAARRLLSLVAIPVALSMLPPAWTPQLMLTREFRLQTVAIAICLLVVVLSGLLRRVIPVVLEVATGGLALLAGSIPVARFLSVRPAIDAVYGRPVTSGWGLWLMPAGFGLVALVLVLSRLPVRPRT
jgi:hypothetical protein